MIRSLCFLLVAASVGVLVGCNTVQGMGQDIEAAGKRIQKSTR
ncbi:MAG TPA: entericidin A/B family lipoprotein [Burkholderiales bacterium]|nr:entericidin A/B family lipoprotein [Burkholderiales bacterium]